MAGSFGEKQFMTETPRPADESTTAANTVESMPSHPVAVTETDVATNDVRQEEFDRSPETNAESFSDDVLDELVEDDSTDEVSLEGAKSSPPAPAPRIPLPGRAATSGRMRSKSSKTMSSSQS